MTTPPLALDLSHILPLLPSPLLPDPGARITSLTHLIQMQLPSLDTLITYKINAFSYAVTPEAYELYISNLFDPTLTLLSARLETIALIREDVLTWFSSLTERLPARNNGTSDVTMGFELLERLRRMEDETADELRDLKVAKDQRWGSTQLVLAWNNNLYEQARELEAWMESSKLQNELACAQEKINRARGFMHRLELAWGDCVDEESGFFNQLVAAVREGIVKVLPTNPLPGDLVLFGVGGKEYGRGLQALHDVLGQAYQTLSNSRSVWEYYVRYTHSFKTHLASAENALDLASCAANDLEGQNCFRAQGMEMVTSMAAERDAEVAALDWKWDMEVLRGILPTIEVIKGCIQGRAMASGAEMMGGGPTFAMYSNALTSIHTTRMNVIENIAGSGQMWGMWDPVKGWK